MTEPYLIIPSENRTREFDAKLLTACCAVEAGYRVVVGSRHDIHLSIDRLPRSTYVGKDLRASSALMTRILTRLGHRIVAWDEEGLVYHTRAHYLAARVHAPVMRACDLLFAWGQDNAEVWRNCQHYDGTPIKEVGNPRIDLLRPELRPLHQAGLDGLQSQFGQYILVNSNFGGVNHVLSDAEKIVFGRLRCKDAAAYHREMLQYRRGLFARFVAALPMLAEAFPGTAIVVRPHPSENPQPWVEAARGHANVYVRHEGGIVPWLLGARAIVHNGCTTAIEGTILGRRVINFQPVASDLYDIPLPNALSETARDLDDLIGKLRCAEAGAPRHDAHPDDVLHRHVAALEGPLSSDRVVASIKELGPMRRRTRGTSLLQGLRGYIQASSRRRRKTLASDIADHKNSTAYNLHRFQPIALAEVQASIEQMRHCLGRFDNVGVRRLLPNVFELGPVR
jgi:surface carbohydrate biosynthesis protein